MDIDYQPATAPSRRKKQIARILELTAWSLWGLSLAGDAVVAHLCNFYYRHHPGPVWGDDLVLWIVCLNYTGMAVGVAGRICGAKWCLAAVLAHVLALGLLPILQMP
jgi:hypothetical protein